MSAPDNSFTGQWLHQGEMRGQQFSHSRSEFQHDDEGGSTAMRHAYVEQEGRQVGVWVPASWNEEQVRQALETNW